MPPLDRHASSRESKGVQPLLKWAGGKRQLAPKIIPFLDGGKRTYYEPFVGGAAMFFALRPNRAVLGDVNQELIECYHAIRNSPRELSDILGTMENSAKSYYRIRAEEPQSALARAARLIFLTSLSFNGIYRQNIAGKFNVPYGGKLTKKLPAYEELKAVSESLSKVSLRATDFESCIADAKDGDVVYFDPPYTVTHNNNGFVKYNASIFSWEDQRRLAEVAKTLVRKGCRVVVSNADHNAVRDLYVTFDLVVLQRRSVIAADSSKRRSVTECLFISKS